MLDGWTYEDMTLKADCRVCCVDWPNGCRPVSDWWVEEYAAERAARYRRDERARNNSKKLFADSARPTCKARSAANGVSSSRRDARLGIDDRGVIAEQKIPLIVTADDAGADSGRRRLQPSGRACKLILSTAATTRRTLRVRSSKSTTCPVVIAGVYRNPREA